MTHGGYHAQPRQRGGFCGSSSDVTAENDVFAEENQILKDMESMSSNMSSVRVVDPISFGVIGSEVTC